MSKHVDKSRIYYDKPADDYDTSYDGRFTLRFKLLLADFISLEAGSRVPDIACGNGTLLAILNEKKPIAGYGVDISPQMIKNAAAKNPDMELHVADCENLPFDYNTMDIITVCAAFHHFPNVDAFAAEAARALRAKGRLCISEIYLPAPLRQMANLFLPLSKACDVKFYYARENVNIFTRHGFEKTDFRRRSNVQIISMMKP